MWEFDDVGCDHEAAQNDLGAKNHLAVTGSRGRGLAFRLADHLQEPRDDLKRRMHQDRGGKPDGQWKSQPLFCGQRQVEQPQQNGALKG
jgi:hypothetical protein